MYEQVEMKKEMQEAKRIIHMNSKKDINRVLVTACHHSFLDLDPRKEVSRWSLRPSSGGSIQQSHFYLMTNTGTGETAQTGGTIHT